MATYQEAVTEAAVALKLGEDANWELARLTDENVLPTNIKEGSRGYEHLVTMQVWADDVQHQSGRRFGRSTARRYRKAWRDHGHKSIHDRPTWTDVWQSQIPEREEHKAVAERGAKYTAEQGDADVAADMVRRALERPEVADKVVADAGANRAVTHAKQRYEAETRDVTEAEYPVLRGTRHTSERADWLSRFTQWRNQALNAADIAAGWELTEDEAEEWRTVIDQLVMALQGVRTAPNRDDALEALLKGTS